jgi:hypothetical protein
VHKVTDNTYYGVAAWTGARVVLLGCELSGNTPTAVESWNADTVVHMEDSMVRTDVQGLWVRDEGRLEMVRRD